MPKPEKDWRAALGNVVYSTNPDYQAPSDEEEEETPEAHLQQLIILTDSKHRKGKLVTLIQGFMGKEEDLEALAKTLKTKCGVGGSAKDGEIVLQGDFRQKASDILQTLGYKVKIRK